jgi:GTP-binding protein HflX
VDDERLEEMIGAVDAILTEIGADEVPVELVLNKVDRVDPLRRRRLANAFPGSLQIAAATGAGIDELRERIAERFSDRYVDVRMLLPYEDGGTLAELYALGAPIEEREDGEEGVRLRARLPQREVRRFARFLVAHSEEPVGEQRKDSVVEGR